MLNRSASLAMSTCVLKALPGKLDIKRHSPSILYVSIPDLCLLLFSLISGPLFCHAECCPDGWLSFQDSCYLFSNTAGLHYTEAEVN